MNREWSLKEIYESCDSQEYRQDKKKLAEMVKGLEGEMAALQNENPKEGLEKGILLMEELTELAKKLGTFLGLSQAVNMTDSKIGSELGQFERIMAGASKGEVMFRRYVSETKNLEEMIDSSLLLSEYRYLLKGTKKEASHLLSDDLESMIAKMNLSGGSAWSRLFEYLTSTVRVDYRGEVTNLSTVRGLAYSADASERKDAYEAELACYSRVEDSVAFALNSIKSQVSMLAEERGYESPLAMTLEQSHMKRETLDAMFTAMNEYFPVFWKYLKAKAKYLGHENGMPWYDMCAPVGKLEGSYTPEDARRILVTSFGRFSKDMADMMDQAFEESWIDFYPHDGKTGGAFCANADCLKQSRILTNFTGTFDSVITLAHELGHAYHNMHTFGHRILNRDYSMPVAETASTFNETFITMNAIENSKSDEEKLALLETILQGTTQVICDIYSRFLFEDEVFSSCRDRFLMSSDLKEIMLSAQKKAYGDGLDANFLHPYMWTCKSHYYSEGLSYYNFPYAFGALFSMGLYSIYEKEGESFVPRYQALLEATPVMDAEDVAKMAGIDLTKPDFWRQSLKSFEKLSDEFARLAEK